MNLINRINLMSRLGEYMRSDEPDWVLAKEKAYLENGWFIPAFTDLAATHISRNYLDKPLLEEWAARYDIKENNIPRSVGIVMAGNIPLVGFHDLLAVFISGNKAVIKPSSKDSALLKQLVAKLTEWDPAVAGLIRFQDMLKDCDAYIATGSNNSSRYFDYYFGKYPHIIRRNRTSAAILTGTETPAELEQLADDVHLYFGLGCRNVTKIFVPEGYPFVPLLESFRKYSYFADHHKYKNNYDYNLAICIMNNTFYMTNGSLLLLEEQSVFSPISQLNYQYYRKPEELTGQLKNNDDLQCIIGQGFTAFGRAQHPSLTDYADGTDTMHFLTSLSH